MDFIVWTISGSIKVATKALKTPLSMLILGGKMGKSLDFVKEEGEDISRYKTLGYEQNFLL